MPSAMPALMLALCLPAIHAANLVANPGFEAGAEGWALPEQLYRVDAGVAHEGGKSLRFHNEPGGPYLLATQPLPLKAGECYRMSVWVKTEGIASTDTGATVCLEWMSASGYLGGAYPEGVVGAADWQQLVFETARLPLEAVGGHVALYGRAGTQGTAWFDDMSVEEVAGPMAEFRFADMPATERRKAALAGLVTEPVRLEVELSKDRGVSCGGLRVEVLLQSGGLKRTIEGGPWQDGRSEVLISGDALFSGETGADLRLVSTVTDRAIAHEIFSIVRKPMMRMDMVAPNPAGAIGVDPAAGDELVARVTLARRDPGEVTRYLARLTLSTEGQAVDQVEAEVADDAPALVRIPTARLGLGLHDLQCDLLDGSGGAVARAQAAVTKADPKTRPANATWLGDNRMLMVAGKPFIPVGFYILSSLETVPPADKPWNWTTGKLYPSYYEPILDRLAKSHFNCVMDYGSTMAGMEPARKFLDAAHERGIRVIFSVKDLMPGAYSEIYTRNLPWKDLDEATRNVVAGLKDHPALIAWYVNDEVFQPENWQGAVDVFRNVRATDPWHPTWAVHYDYTGLGKYREACDVIGTDPYSLLDDINFTARSWRECRKLLGPDMPFWAVVQCFGPGYETSNPAYTQEPSFDEERAATMAAIAEGATGIIYYCYHSLQRSPRFEERFAELDRIAAEVQGLAPFIAQPDAKEPVTVVSGDVSVLTKGVGAALVVSTQRTDQEVTLSVPEGVGSVVDMSEGAGGHWPVQEGKVTLPMKALGVRFLTW